MEVWSGSADTTNVFAVGLTPAVTLDSLPTHVAVLDPRGTIQYVNTAWQRYGSSNEGQSSNSGVGQNYLAVCDAATGLRSDEAIDTANGIRSVLRGELAEFTLDYPCHSPNQHRWFRLRAAPIVLGDAIGAVVMHADITRAAQEAEAHHEAERLSRESERRLHSALEAAQIGDWSLDLRTGITDRSLRHDQCFGYEAPLPVWSHDRFLAHVETTDRVRVAASFKRALAGGGDFSEQYQTIWADGSPHWLWSRGSVSFDDHGEPARVVGIVVDITARKLSELTEQSALERLNEAQRISGIGDWAWDSTSGKITWSRQVFRIAGRDPDLGAPRDLDELGAYCDADSDVVQHRHIAAAIATGEKQVYELASMRSGGEQQFTQVIVWPHTDVTGTVVALHGTIEDITERKQADFETARLASLVASSTDAILSLDLDGTITNWNPGAQKLTGYTAEEIVGTSVMRIIPPDRQVEEGQYMKRVALGHSLEHLETIRIAKDGRAIHVSVTAAPIRDAYGAVIGISKVTRDISERKKLEQQFLRAQRMESIGTLAGGIAHDLNNVLSPIMLSLELLKMSCPDVESQELIGVIEGSARHGSEMVRRVLSFARGVEGQRIELDVASLFLDVEKIAKDTFLNHITIRTDVPAELWRVIGDPTQLHQMLLNLCVNARDAMPSGGQLILAAENVTLDAYSADGNIDAKAGSYVVLRVEDSGTGIHPDVLERIFDPFFTTKEVGQGTGLGLSTSIAIVKSHGGFMRPYSELGRGSRFNVYLPARAATTVDVGTAVPELLRGHGELVLVVDDEPAIRQVTQRLLEAFGYRVLSAVDGTEAVAIYARRSNEIAVVLTDMMMPVMDGPATIRELRKMNPAVRIIAASGLDASAHVAGLGVAHFLAKPYATDRLLTTLRQALANPV